MRLGELMGAIPGAVLERGDADVDILDITLDSREVRFGSLFCCVSGTRDDGHRYAQAAVEAGAVALLSDSELPELSASTTAVVRVAPGESRRACAALSAAILGYPAEDLTIVGVTGTNGKTTVTSILGVLLAAAGYEAEVIGTLTSTRTTPAAPQLQHRFAEVRDRAKEKDRPGVVAMEVSSHALDQDRVAGVHFAVAIFTNLSHDHLDYHGTLEKYFEAKAKLFTQDSAGLAVIWSETEEGRTLLSRRSGSSIAVGWDAVSDLLLGPQGSSFVWRNLNVSLPLFGHVNVINALLAAEAAVALGIAPETVATAIASLQPVPGRMERVSSTFQGPVVLVDYAHTPDALRAALLACREVAQHQRVIVVFGCGGDRDAAKRPVMGGIASQLADVVFVTTDNPRHENPDDIANAILSGVDGSAEVFVEANRAIAIRKAISLAGLDDVILIAGKGHETTQEFADRIEEFDDRVVAQSVLREFGKQV